MTTLRSIAPIAVRCTTMPVLAAAAAAATLLFPAGLASAHAASAASSAHTASASAAAIAGPTDWIEDDMPRAMQLAASRGRYLLIDFTGSNWCGWCIKLDQEVFDHPLFAREASRDFVFAKLDFPRPSNQSEEVKRHNEQWRAALRPTGFPTIFLADAKGRPFARTGYRPGGVSAYVAHLRELVGLRRSQERLVTRAMGLEGLERARGLGEALAIQGIMTPEKPEILEQIKAADPEDTLGLLARFGSPGKAVVPPGGGTEAGEKKVPEKPKTPFQRDLEAVAAMIEAGDTDEAAGALRRIQQAYRPKGAELAEWTLVRMDFLTAIGRPAVAAAQAERAMRMRDVPAADQQRLGHRRALALLAAGKGNAALAAWDRAIALAGGTDLAAEMTGGRDDFADRCRAAGG